MSSPLEPKDFQDNRRTEPRVSAKRQIDILPCQATAQWKFIVAELIDCSRHGLALLLPMEMPVGSQFLVKLKLSGGIKLLLYTVHNCASWQRSIYRVGARFSGFAAQEVEDDPEKVMDALLKGE